MEVQRCSLDFPDLIYGFRSLIASFYDDNKIII